MAVQGASISASTSWAGTGLHRTTTSTRPTRASNEKTVQEDLVPEGREPEWMGNQVPAQTRLKRFRAPKPMLDLVFAKNNAGHRLRTTSTTT